MKITVPYNITQFLSTMNDSSKKEHEPLDDITKLACNFRNFIPMFLSICSADIKFNGMASAKEDTQNTTLITIYGNEEEIDGWVIDEFLLKYNAKIIH